MKIIIDSHYAPNIAWWKLVAKSSDVLIEEASFFRKGSYRNRCEVFGANGLLRLSIPRKKGREERSNFNKVEISYDHNWQKLHWESLCSAYRSSPYFEFYEHDIQPLYHSEEVLLKDFNFRMIQKIQDLIGINVRFTHTNEYLDKYIDREDFREIIHPNPWKDDVATTLNFKPYIQVFSHKLSFLPNLSILDLLFNLGPNTASYLLE